VLPTSTTTIDYTYVTQRLAELGIDEKQNTFHRTWTSRSDDTKDGKIVTTEKQESRNYKILDADQEGNIAIRYFNLHGQPYRWKSEDSKQSRDFIRKRLREPKGDMKYKQDPGSPQFPFFPKAIIEKFKLAKEWHDQFEVVDGKRLPKEGKAPAENNPGQLHTLFLVEGEIKSIKASLCGVDIVGLPSIHGFYNGDIKGRLHEDIEELLITCQVQKIVFLVDADLLSLKWAEGKDLAKRAYSFYGSIKAFRESLQHLIDNELVDLELVYFMHQRIKFMNDAKGLDDLLVKYPEKTLDIVADLHNLNSARVFFDCFMINDISKDIQGRVFKLLGLTDEQEFYKTYADFIGNREFKFKRRRYIYDSEKREAVFVKHEDAEKFMRVGPDWVKLISKKNKHGEMEEEIVPWKISEIQRDYGKKFPDFIETIIRYDDFCNEPSWNGSYQQSIHGCYNVCRPLKWQPKAGSIKSTAGFLKHLFGGQGNIILDDQGMFEREDAFRGDQFTVALDYLTVMLKHPKQMLPVPCLVSPENGTGKSTFLKWLQMIFGDNMCILGNAQFQMKFNGHYATKYIISIDEGFLEVDKKAEKERLKQLVTSDSIYLEHKGMNVRKINYYGKIIICSNDADRLMKIDEGESRWFVVRVPVIPKEKKDPDLEAKMKIEAEAWLHFLFNRPVFHQRVDRLWFAPEDFITDQMKIIVETTKNRVDRVFEDWIQEQFMLYKLPVLRFSQKYLTEVFNDPKNSKYKIDAIELKGYLERKKMTLDVPQRIKIPMGFNLPQDVMMQVSGSMIAYKEEMARPYKFVADDWLAPSQMDEFNKPFTTVTDLSKTGKNESTDENSSGGNTDDLPF
jgi:hypothetical protein